jgi:hypothetical protein
MSTISRQGLYPVVGIWLELTQLCSLSAFFAHGFDRWVFSANVYSAATLFGIEEEVFRSVDVRLVEGS